MPRRRLRAAAALTTAAAGLALAAPAQGAPAEVVHGWSPQTHTCADAGIGVSPQQGSIFYVDVDSDPAQALMGSYFGYQIRNDGPSPLDGLWVRLERFEGPISGAGAVDAVGPAAGGDVTKALPVAELAPGGHQPTYAYLRATTATEQDQHHDVVVYQGHPDAGGVALCRETQVLTQVADVLEASANKVTSAHVSTSAPALGGAFDLVVNGQTGTFGAGYAEDLGALRFTPAVRASWPSSAFRLIGIEHSLTPEDGGNVFTDVLGRNGLQDAASSDYTVTYRFRVVGPTATPTPITPVSYIASGQPVKHTDIGSTASLAPIPVVVNRTTLAVTAPTPGTYAAGDPVRITATITNAGDGPVDVDALALTVPDGWAAVPGSAKRDGAAIDDPHVDGQGLQLVGPFTVLDAGDNSDGTSTFTVDLVAAEQPGTLTAWGTLDGGQIDTTEADDDSPASVLLSVQPVEQEPPAEEQPPAGPNAEPVLTSGVGVERHSSTIPIPAGGRAHLLGANAAEVDELDVPDVGRYTILPYTGEVSFVPVLGFWGTAPAVSWIVYDADDRSDTATWVATVSKPAAPAAVDEESEATGTTPQTRTITIPEGGSVTLLGPDGDPTDVLVVDDVGTFTLDPDTGEVTFVPVFGYSGRPDAIPFRIVDAYGQADEGLYAPRVLAPPLAPAAPQATAGDPGDPQTHAVVLPQGGHLALLDAQGDPVAELVVAGVGTFTVTDGGDTISFVPAPGFTGVAPAVTYVITDAYGQQTSSTYVAEVRSPDPMAEPVVEAPPLVASPLAAVLDEVAALVPATAGGVLDTNLAAPATCASRRTMRIHWLVPRGTTLRRVVVSVSGKRVQRLPGRARAVTVDFRGRPAERLVVRIVGRTTTGKLLQAERTYRTCVGRIAHPPLKTLRLLAPR